MVSDMRESRSGDAIESDIGEVCSRFKILITPNFSILHRPFETVKILYAYVVMSSLSRALVSYDELCFSHFNVA